MIPTEVVSFRDPAGSVVLRDDRVFRVIWKAGEPDFRAFLASEQVRALVEGGAVVETRVLSGAELGTLSDVVTALAERRRSKIATVVEHTRVAFPSFPHEWSPEMLRAAGRLTLELASKLLDDGLGLKDATPFNVQFRGSAPTFVDILSVERRDHRDFIWLPEGQFVRTFVLPLLAHRYFGLAPHSMFLSARDGLEPDALYRLCGLRQRLLPPFLMLVTVPAWLSRYESRAAYGEPRRASSEEKARFVLARSFGRLSRGLSPGRSGRGGSTASHWSRYMDQHSYDDADFRAKEAFVSETLADADPEWVLDVGCNTGHFSMLAARAGARVVAIDADPAVIDATWRSAEDEKLDILPLIQNLARPSPALGWRYGESPSFLERARKRFDVVLCLAVIHHLMVSEGIPLAEIVDLVAELTTDVAVIEFVGRGDPMFVKLCRGRDELYDWLDLEQFEAACQRRFEVIGKKSLGNPHRVLFRLRVRDE